MLHGEGRDDPFFELKRFHEDYKVFDVHYENVGKVDDLFVDADGQTRYIVLATGGLLGGSSTLVPVELVRVNDKRGVVEVADSKDKIENAPSLEDDADLTPDYEDRIRSYFGLEPLWGTMEEPPLDERGRADDLVEEGRVDLVPGERVEPRDLRDPTLERAEDAAIEEEREERAMEEERAMDAMEEREPPEESLREQSFREEPLREEPSRGESSAPRVRRIRR